MSTVDVVIPCYNYGRYLKGCVQSVLDQPGVEVRILILDDASKDDSPLIAQELAYSDSRVQFRRHEKNCGHIATYNEGLLEWSTGDYVVLLSADDLLAPGSLERAVSVMNSDKKIGLVYGSTIHFEREEQLPSGNGSRFSYRRWSGHQWLKGRCRSAHNVITSPEVVVRGAVQRKVGGYRPELPHAGDLEMWLRIAAISDIAYIMHTPQAYYRVHSSSMMRTVYKGVILDLMQRKAVFDCFFDHHRHNISDSDTLQFSANRSLAREALWDACRAYDHNQVDTLSASDLVSFAFQSYPDTASLPEYAALQRRMRLGPALCQRTQVFAGAAAVRRVQSWVAKERWKRQGV